MHHLTRFVTAGAVLAVSVLSLSVASGCQSASQRRVTTAGPGGKDVTGQITIDGHFDDWPADVAISSDEHYLYLRMKVEQSHAALQASQESLVIWLDLDDNPATGLKPTGSQDLASLGVDLAIEFSPRSPKGPRGGVRMSAYDAGGVARELNHSDLALHFAPSYAAEWTELRFARRSDLVPALGDKGHVRGAFAIFDASSQLVGWSDPITVAVGEGSPPPQRQVELPTKPEGAIRVMSWNALRDAPSSNPKPFARVFQAINPDIVLIQEWDADAKTIASWFNRAMGTLPGSEDQTWTVRDSAAWGVAIASKYPMQPLGPDSPDPAGSSRHPTRFVGALVVTPLGDVAAGSVHLKCCGAAGSKEDNTRRAQAFEINKLYSEAVDTSSPDAVRIIGGDFNLVGTRDPLDALRTGLDSDGKNMIPANARVLGDTINATWEDHESRYASGRLDWLVFGDHNADLLQAFVLDTTRLTDDSLARMGLDRKDTAASDHNPVVVDLKPTRGW